MEVDIEHRLSDLMSHLNLKSAHFAARTNSDWRTLVRNRPDLIESLALIAPPSVDPDVTATLDRPVFVVTDAEGTYGTKVQRELESLPGALSFFLAGGDTVSWTDLMSIHGEVIADAYLSFLDDVAVTTTNASELLISDRGEVAGISYQIYGAGPPIVLLPLFLAPSNWQPVIEKLSSAYQVIVLGGAHLGAVAILESRSGSSTYLAPLTAALETASVQSTHRILEVGCGCGTLTRFLCSQIQTELPITAVDLNGYLLSEGQALATAEGLSEQIDFQPGDALNLPFEKNYFDFVYSITVIEECDAKKMIAELKRVTKPGGIILVICRAVDIPYVANVDIPDRLKAKIQNMPGMVSPVGCADSSLYTRMVEHKLDVIENYPCFATFRENERYIIDLWESAVLATLTDDERSQWKYAKQSAIEAGTFFLGWPLHCVLAKKSGSAD